MLRGAEMVAIVGASLALTSGVMWTRSVAAGPERPADAMPGKVRIVLTPEAMAPKAIRVVHPDYVRRNGDEPEGERWVDPYRVRRVVER